VERRQRLQPVQRVIRIRCRALLGVRKSGTVRRSIVRKARAEREEEEGLAMEPKQNMSAGLKK
jgi:hypothetical protein